MSKIDYQKVEDYYLPKLRLEKTNAPTGKLGRLYLQYLKNHKKALYTALFVKGKLALHVLEVERDMLKEQDIIIQQMLEKEKITEQMKMENQMLWVQKMNMIKLQAEKIVLTNFLK